MITHDEVMAWIDSKIAKFNLAQRQSGDDSEHEWWEISIASLLANRAGLERHNSTKTQYGKPMCDCCYAQNGDSSLRQPFPCSSYTDISNLIRSVMG